MITGALISILSWVILGVSFFLPTGNFLPANFADLLSDIIGYAYSWDWLIPVTTMIEILSATIIFYVAELAWKGGKYMLHLLRGN